MNQATEVPIKYFGFKLQTFINLVTNYTLFKDIVKLFIIILLLILSIYKSPDFIKVSFLYIILVIFYFSKPRYDYFWIIIALVLVDNPCSLFWHTTDYVFKVGIAKFSFLNVFAVISLIKILIKKGYTPLSSFLKKPFIFYLIFLLIAIINGLTIGIGGGGRTGFRYLYIFSQIILVLPLFYSIPKMLNDEASVLKFINLIYILIIINFLGQIFSVLARQNIHFLLGGKVPKNWDEVFYSREDLVRPIFGIYINLIGFITSFYYYFSKTIYFKKKYLIFIIFICFSSILIIATRGWFIAYTVFLLLILFTSLKEANI